MPEAHSDDPIQTRSFAGALLISAFLLLLTVAWSLYDEFYGLRPWRSYQRQFAAVYAKFLKKEIPKQRDREKAIQGSAEYQKLDQQVRAAEEAAKPRLREIDQESGYIDRRLAALTDTFQEARGKVTALVYNMELAPLGSSSRNSRMRGVQVAKSELYTLELPTPAGTIEKKKLTFDQLDTEFNSLKARKAQLVAERGEVLRSAKQLRDQRDAYSNEKM